MKALAGCRIGRMITVVIVLLGLVALAPLQAATIYVSTAGSDANDGRTWVAARKTVRGGLNAAGAGDQVWVAAGTYAECIDLKAGVALYGGFAGGQTDLSQRNWVANATILDGSQLSSVVRVPSGADVTTRIDGFTIRNGKGTRNVSGDVCGGGIYIRSCSPTIANNTIIGNSAGDSSYAYGGGLYLEQSSAVIISNTIAGNTAFDQGGGLYLRSSSPTIANNTVAGNSAHYEGGGLYLYLSSPKIVNNTIVGNSTTSTVYADAGGGLYLYFSSPTIANTIVAFNTSGVRRYDTSNAPVFRCNCVYGNRDYDYSNLADPTGIDGNIKVDPRLADPAYRKLHLQPDSPCIDAGNDTDTPAGWTDMDGQARLLGTRVDIGADESDGTTWPAGPNVIVRVSPAGSDANDGSSWAQARRTVQAGIDDAAAAGGDVWVAAGTYVQLVTLRPYAHVYGGFAGTETQRQQRDHTANATVLDGNQSGSVVAAVSMGPGLCTLDGFTITNGSSGSGGGVYLYHSSPTITNNTITGNTASNNGGGLCMSFSSAIVTNNTITGNSTTSCGGGLSLFYCSSATIANNTITGNSATGSAGSGGGLWAYNSTAMISNNRITGNTAEYWGGGMRLQSSSPMIVNNVIANNKGAFGGAMHLYLSSPTIVNSTISGNSAGTYGSGGGLFLDSSSPTIAGAVVTGNAAYGGGGLYVAYSSPTIVCSTIVGNKAHGGGLYLESSSPVVANTIVAFNSSGICSTSSGTPSFRCNCIFGNSDYNLSGLRSPIGANGNVSVDPQFVSAGPGPDGIWGTADDTYGDLRLTPGSPCVDAGSNSDVPADATDLDGDSNTTEPLPMDLAGGPRFLDDPTAPDAGVGTAPIVDIGAYERNRPATDVDGNWRVDVIDLLWLIDTFGKAAGDSGYNAACDFNGDDAVDVIDLLTMIEQFGK